MGVNSSRSLKVLTLTALIVAAITVASLVLAPKVLWFFAPNSLREISQERVAHELYWRVQFYIRKATGGVPDLSWAEVIKGTWPGTVLEGTWPGSGFIMESTITDGRSLEAAVENPLDGPEDIARGKEIFLANCAGCHGNDARADMLRPWRSPTTASAAVIWRFTRRCATAFPVPR
jgi:hypothetical protein